MKLIFVSDARLPTEKAHGLAIMKTCDALRAQGIDIELVIPARHNVIKEDPFDYYGISARFPVKKLFTVDLVRWGRVGFLIQEILFALSCAAALRSERETVIYGRDELVLALLSLFGYRKLVWEAHMGAWSYPARFVAHRVSRVVTISEGLKTFYVEHLVDGAKIAVVPSAIDLDDFSHPEEKAASRRRLGLPLEAQIALYIGRLDGWKGTDTLLEAAKLLSPIRVAVIGGEPAQIESLQKEYPEVLFLGYQPYRHLADNQAAADVLVVPNTGKDIISARFTSPLKLVAHLASGRPIVASDLPSIREIVGNGEAALVEPDNPQALAEHIAAILRDKERAARLVENARKKSRLYGWDSRAAAIIRLVEPMLRGKKIESRKILFLINSLAVGGAEKVFIEQANELYERGWDVKFACLFYDGALFDQLRIPRKDIYSLRASSIFDLRAIFRIRAVLRDAHVNTLYTTLNEANTVGRFVKCLYPTVRLYTREANMTDVKPLLYKGMDLLFGWTSSTIIAVSEAVKDSICAYAPVLRTRIRVLYNGIRIPETIPIRKETGQIRILTVGSLTPKKDQSVLITAMASLPAHFVLTIVGSGRLKDELKNKVRELGLGDRVTFAGHVSPTEIATYYQAHDLFVLPSYREGCPNVVSEAQSFGLPVVVFTIPGMREFVDTSCGAVVEERDPDALAHAIRSVAVSRSHMSELGRCGHTLVSKTRAHHIQIERLIALLEE